MLLLACLELRGGGQQKQDAGKVFVELIEGDLLQLFCRVADDDVIPTLELLSLVDAFFPCLLFLEDVPPTLAVVLDGRLFKDGHEMGEALVGDDLRDAGNGKLTEEIFAVYADGGGAEPQLLRGLLQTGQVCAFQVRTHHVPQAGDGDLLFVMEAHHCETGGSTVRGVVLPDVGITHRCFLFGFYLKTPLRQLADGRFGEEERASDCCALHTSR